VDIQRIDAILDAAAADGRFGLFEHEVYDVLRAAGCRVPRTMFVRPGDALDRAGLAELGGGSVILKVVAPGIVHKTDVGGVRATVGDPAAVQAGIEAIVAEVPRRHARDLEQRRDAPQAAYAGLTGGELEEAIRRDIRGVLVAEKVELEGEGVGSEVIVALRHSRDFGPVVTFGVGGVDAELFAGSSERGRAVATASAALRDAAGLLAEFRATLSYRRLAGLTRTGGRLVNDEQIRRVLDAMVELGQTYGYDGEGRGWTITELEVNPFAASRGQLVALDGLLSFRARAALPPARPEASLDAMLLPQSMAIIGVSARGANTGRIILDNVREAGFDPGRMFVVHPSSAEIGGVRCVPSIRDLPERVDLFVVAVGAEQVPSIVEELGEHGRATGVIVIPGGMAEKEGGRALEERLQAGIARARALGQPVVVNGGNCLGIVSRPGRYDTLFIPRTKLPVATGEDSSLAIISQSGAFMITRMSKLPWLRPRYAISTGNQADLTIGDFMRHIAGDPAVRTFAVYVEGFRDADGLAFARVVEEVVADGRDVVFYKAGRTSEGRRATSGHTASLAGDYAVCEAIVGQAGALVAKTFDEYLGLLRVSVLAGSRNWRGRRVAAMSNAGYEAVGIADGLRGEGWNLELAGLGSETRASLQAALAGAGADSLVDVHNPLDLTPMADDEAHERVLRALLADPGVDLVLCSTVPLTAATATLPDEIASKGSLPNRLGRVLRGTDKPLVVSIDAGPLYDQMAAAIEQAGVPVFRSVDAALAAMGRLTEQRLHPHAQTTRAGSTPA
jgi:acyl-CoA synthetase (NDP forming)